MFPTPERTVTIRLLGSIEAYVNDMVVDLGGPRQRRLLALLALRAGDRVDAAELIDAVWPEGDLPHEPRETLCTCASRLRRSLGDSEAIVAKAGAYSLHLDPTAIDANVFESLTAPTGNGRRVEALRAALALWHGPALAGFEHEQWARPTATRLTEMRHNANDDLGRAYLDQGWIADAVALLEGVVNAQPLRERSHRLLMQALHRSGRSAEALRVFQDFRRRLATDLGLEPGHDIVSIERAILDGASVDEPSPGRRCDARGYRLLEPIGVGAFAVVFRGVQTAVDREVAIKVIRPELVGRGEFTRRLEAEAQLVARLEHPHIVPLYDCWRESGAAWLVMRLLRGGTLAERIGEGPLPIDEVVAMVTQIGDALDAVHRAGVVHGDVKPANVYLDGDGNWFLGDFGIAHGSDPVTDGLDSMSTGSPGYASPEQLQRLEVGPPADVLGLAITVFECLAGHLPFHDAATGAELRRRQLLDPIPPLRPYQPDIPRRLDDVLARATAKDPARRHLSPGEFVADLIAVIDGDRHVDRPIGRPIGRPARQGEAARRWRYPGRRRPLRRALARLRTHSPVAQASLACRDRVDRTGQP